MVGTKRWLRVVGWLVAISLIGACSSSPSSEQEAGPILAGIPDEVWDTYYGEGKLSDGPPAVETLDLDAYLAEADPALRALHEHAGARGVGEIVEAATVSFPSGVTARVAVTTGPGGRLGLVVSDPELPEGGYFTTFDADGVLEISTPDFLVRFYPDGETVEEWNAHSSCKTSHCVEAGLNRLMGDFWWILAPGALGIAYICPYCDTEYSNAAEEAAGEAACIACIIPMLAFILPLIPMAMAAAEECVFNNPCNWCMDDGCGSDELSRVCTYDTYNLSPGNDYVLLETGTEYYCSNPDDYQRCEGRQVTRLIEGCPYGCSGNACATQPPTCDQAICHAVIGPVGTEPYCLQAGNGRYVLMRDYEERNCLPLSGGGEGCQGEIVPHEEAVCPSGCAADGHSCAATSSVTLEVYEHGRSGLVRCAACWMRLRGSGGTFGAVTNADGTVTFLSVPDGDYFVEYGCGADSLGPHSPADVYPDIPTTWVPAESPWMNPDLASANVVAPTGRTIRVPIDGCGPQPVCSASNLSPVPVAQDLPTAVAATRDQIVEAAVACDYAALASLAASGTYFAYSLDESGDPAGYWQSLEQSGAGEPLRSMVTTLNLPAEAAGVGGDEGAYYLWSDGAGGATIYRTGISTDGDWLFFLPDD